MWSILLVLLLDFFQRRVSGQIDIYSNKTISNYTSPVPNLSDPFIEITVSPVANRATLRILDISWRLPQDQWRTGDWVALYEDPPNSKSQAYVFRVDAGSELGRVRTNVPENKAFPEEHVFKKVCLGWYAAYWRAGDNETTPVTTTCLTTNPTWMLDNWNYIKNVKLRDLFIPGTHDSGAYQLAYSPFEPSRYQKYVFAQDESIMEQLIHGARYLDFRIGKYPSGFWINHDIARVHILDYALEDVKTFLSRTKEIVIIDFHGFPVGFKNRGVSHQELFQYLKEKVGDQLARFMGYEVTLQQVRDTGKRLIIAYNDGNVADRHPEYLWPPLPQKWGNVQSVPDLYHYIKGLMNGRAPRQAIWAAMAEITPDAWGVITDKYGGLRTLADTTNRNVTRWFRSSWGGKANVVAVDFIRSSGIVSTAIMWNRAKGASRMLFKRSLIRQLITSI